MRVLGGLTLTVWYVWPPGEPQNHWSVGWTMERRAAGDDWINNIGKLRATPLQQKMAHKHWDNGSGLMTTTNGAKQRRFRLRRCFRLHRPWRLPIKRYACDSANLGSANGSLRTDGRCLSWAVKRHNNPSGRPFGDISGFLWNRLNATFLYRWFSALHLKDLSLVHYEL